MRQAQRPVEPLKRPFKREGLVEDIPGLIRIDNVVLRQRRVYLRGYHFTRCRFIDCDLVREEPYADDHELEECTFTRSPMVDERVTEVQSGALLLWLLASFGAVALVVFGSYISKVMG